MEKPYALELPEMRKQVNNEKFTYYEFGNENGIPIVMIHGNHGSAFSFAEIIPLLGEYRLIVPDLPGCGRRPAMTDEYSNDPKMASGYCFSVIDNERLEKYILIGHSLGSMIITDMCDSDRKDEIMAAILIETFLNMPERPVELINIEHFPGANEEIQAKVEDAFDDGEAVEWYKTFDISTKVRDFSMPVLELQGEAFPDTDHLYEKFVEEHRSNMPSKWKLIRVPGAGHFLHVEKPQITAGHIKSFITDNTGA